MRGALLELFLERAPDGRGTHFANQLYRFVFELRVGDTVVTYDRERRIYAWGTVRSDYEWAEELADGAPHVRRVQWTHQILRDELSPAARNTLGSIMTLFRLNDEVVAELRAEIVEKADEFNEDRIARLGWDQLQELVAGILRAMGYRTTVSPPGRDRGVVIFASRTGSACRSRGSS